jgi:hypothetical protein
MEREGAREDKHRPERPRPGWTLVADRTRGYRRAPVRIGITGRTVQLASAVAAVAVAILLAARSAWPFDASRPRLPARPSLWQLLLSDHVTLGFVRLAFVMLAVFVIASVPALAAVGSGRRASAPLDSSRMTLPTSAARSRRRSESSSERPRISRQ